jgi:hypothetical protein
MEVPMRDHPNKATYNGSEVGRLIVGDPSFATGDPADYPIVQGKVRATLERLGCPRKPGSYRPQFEADRAMVNKVADALGRPRPFPSESDR